MSRLVEIVFKWSQKPLGGHDLKLDPRAGQAEPQRRRGLTSPSSSSTSSRSSAPVSQSVSALDYDCEFTGSLSDEGFDFILGVEVPVTALCPCSKEISDRGAHNQRGRHPGQNQLRARGILLDRGPGRRAGDRRQAATYTRCSSAATRSTSPRRPTTRRSSWRTCCATRS